MAYQTTKPAPNDDLDVSVTDIQQNFLTANTVMDINHYPFDNLTVNKGKHKFVDMPVLAGVPTIAAGDGGIYTKLDASTQAQMFYTPDATGNEYQLTRTIAASFAKFGVFIADGALANSTFGWSFLPGGLLFQYGTYIPGNFSGSKTGAINFPTAFTSVPYLIILTPISKANSNENHTLSLSSTTPPTTTTFNYNWDSTTSTYSGFSWTAIGR